jgi:hypothetical protein
MLTTAHTITSAEDLQTFVECYDRAFGTQVLKQEFLEGCEEVFLFRDHEGTPVAGYTINRQQAYRTLDFIPDAFASFYREEATGLQTYELGTIWVDESRRNGREKLEMWVHIFGNMLSRADTVMVGSTASEEIYRFYLRYGVKLAYQGPMQVGDGGLVQGWIVYLDDISTSKVPEMYEQLSRRLGR